jgi:hypothetical protein
MPNMESDSSSRKARAAVYREQAARTRSDAEHIGHPRLRKQMLEIAEELERLADSIERIRRL